MSWPAQVLSTACLMLFETVLNKFLTQMKNVNMIYDFVLVRHGNRFDAAIQQKKGSGFIYFPLKTI